MWLIRLIIFAAIVAGVLYLYRRLTAPRKTVTASQPMKKCAQCGVHFPPAEGISHGSEAFCCDEHRRLWLSQHPPS